MAPRTLTRHNVGTAIDTYTQSIRGLGTSLKGLTGLPLFHALKRERTGVGPYPEVTFFEAANRIMTDLVILYGIRGLFQESGLPFTAYTVEYGNEDKNGFDLRAEANGQTLIGEAFNVSPAFFQVKKAHALRKLRASGGHASHRILLVNDDAMGMDYSPRLSTGERLYRVDVTSGHVRPAG